MYSGFSILGFAEIFWNRKNLALKQILIEDLQETLARAQLNLTLNTKFYVVTE